MLQCSCPTLRYWKSDTECAPCPAGTTSATVDATTCVCPATRYWETPDTCSVCPEGKSSYAINSNECVCPAGSFQPGGNANASCLECPVGVGCGNAGPGVTLATLPLKPNYWRVSPNSTAIGPCYTAGVCVGSTVAQSRKGNASVANASTAVGRRLQSAAAGAVDSSSTFGDSLCRIGHTGAFCEQCAPTYHKDPSGLCNGCDAAGGNVGLTPTPTEPPLPFDPS